MITTIDEIECDVTLDPIKNTNPLSRRAALGLLFTGLICYTDDQNGKDSLHFEYELMNRLWEDQPEIHDLRGDFLEAVDTWMPNRARNERAAIDLVIDLVGAVGIQGLVHELESSLKQGLNEDVFRNKVQPLLDSLYSKLQNWTTEEEETEFRTRKARRDDFHARIENLINNVSQLVGDINASPIASPMSEEDLLELRNFGVCFKSFLTWLFGILLWLLLKFDGPGHHEIIRNMSIRMFLKSYIKNTLEDIRQGMMDPVFDYPDQYLMDTYPYVHRMVDSGFGLLRSIYRRRFFISYLGTLGLGYYLGATI